MERNGSGPAGNRDPSAGNRRFRALAALASEGLGVLMFLAGTIGALALILAVYQRLGNEEKSTETDIRTNQLEAEPPVLDGASTSAPHESGTVPEPDEPEAPSDPQPIEVEPQGPPEPDAEDLEVLIADLKAQRDQLKQKEQAVRQRIASMRDQIATIRQKADRGEKQAESLRLEAERLEAETDRLTAEAELVALERDVLERQVEEARRQRAKAAENPGYAILPYQGPQGTWHRPIPIECRDGSAILQPDGPRFSIVELMPIRGTSGPFIAAIRRISRLLRVEGAPNDNQPVEPYVLLVVRPDGIRPFYEARSTLEALGIPFGYELVSRDLPIEFPDWDDPTIWDDPDQTQSDDAEPRANAPDALADRSRSRPLPTRRLPSTLGDPLSNGPAGGLRSGRNLPGSRPGIGNGLTDRDGPGLGTGREPDGDEFPPHPPGFPRWGQGPDRSFDDLADAGSGLGGLRRRGRSGSGTGSGTSSEGSADGTRIGSGGSDQRRPLPMPRAGGIAGQGGASGTASAFGSGFGSGLEPGPGGTDNRPQSDPPSDPVPDFEPVPPDDPPSEPNGSDQQNAKSSTENASPDRGSDGNGPENRPGPTGDGAGLATDGGGQGQGVEPGGRSGAELDREPDGQGHPLGSEPGSPSKPGRGPSPRLIANRSGPGPNSQPGFGLGPGHSEGPSSGDPSSTNDPNAPSGPVAGRGAGSGSGEGSTAGSGSGSGRGGQGSGLGASNRALKITIGCSPKGVVVYPGGYRLTAKTLEENPDRLIQTVQIITRKHRREDPSLPARPRLQLFIRPGGAETYAKVRQQLAFAQPGWPVDWQIIGRPPFPFFGPERW